MLPYIDLPFIHLAELTGSGKDELKLIASFLLSYPLAAVLKRIPDSKPAQKDLFIIAVSLFYLVGLFDLWSGIRTILISSVGAYALAAKVSGPYMPWIAFVFLMGHMAFSHIYRQFTNDPSVVDITGAQMVLVMKLTAFCWNIHDGNLPEESLAGYQKERRLVELPSLLDYAAYVLFFPSLFAGPAFDFIDYKNWITTSMFEAPPGVDASKLPPTRKKRKIPRSGTPATIKAVAGLIWIYSFLQFSSWYPSSLLLGPTFLRYNIFRRIWLLYVFGFTARLKYYGVWALTEGACIMTGLGYAGLDPTTHKAKWDRLQNVDPFGLETAQNTRDYLGAWNQNTNAWLRNYMYLRVTPAGKKPGFRASMATFVTSAFWHGFYPGYYLAFILAAFLQTVAKNYRRYVRPFFLDPRSGKGVPQKRLYDILSWLATQLSFTFTVAAFILLDLHDSLTVWARVWFYAPIGTALSMAFFASPAKAYLVKQINARSQPQVKRSDSAESTVSGHGGTLGIPSDPGREVEEAIREARNEVEARRRRGSKVENVVVGGVKVA